MAKKEGAEKLVEDLKEKYKKDRLDEFGEVKGGRIAYVRKYDDIVKNIDFLSKEKTPEKSVLDDIQKDIRSLIMSQITDMDFNEPDFRERAGVQNSASERDAKEAYQIILRDKDFDPKNLVKRLKTTLKKMDVPMELEDQILDFRDEIASDVKEFIIKNEVGRVSYPRMNKDKELRSLQNEYKRLKYLGRYLDTDDITSCYKELNTSIKNEIRLSRDGFGTESDRNRMKWERAGMQIIYAKEVKDRLGEGKTDVEIVEGDLGDIPSDYLDLRLLEGVEEPEKSSQGFSLKSLKDKIRGRGRDN